MCLAHTSRAYFSLLLTSLGSIQMIQARQWNMSMECEIQWQFHRNLPWAETLLRMFEQYLVLQVYLCCQGFAQRFWNCLACQLQLSFLRNFDDYLSSDQITIATFPFSNFSDLRKTLAFNGNCASDWRRILVQYFGRLIVQATLFCSVVGLLATGCSKKWKQTYKYQERAIWFCFKFLCFGSHDKVSKNK